MTFTREQLSKAIESFPLSSELQGQPHTVALASMESAQVALHEDIAFCQAFLQAIEENVQFTAFTAQMRELYFQHSLSAHAFINIARCFIQLGYRLHSLEMAESVNSFEEPDDE